MIAALLVQSKPAFADAPFLGVAAECGAQLKSDYRLNIKTAQQQYAYLQLIDQKTYELLKHDASAGAPIPVAGDLVNASATYSDFDNKRNALLIQTKFQESSAQAELDISQVVAPIAYTAYIACITTLARTAPGFYAWKVSEDGAGFSYNCYYNGGPGALNPPPITLKGSVTGGSVIGATAGAIAPSSASRLFPGDFCHQIMQVRRSGAQSITLTIAAGGFAGSVLTSTMAPVLPNSATVVYNTLVDKPDTMTFTTVGLPIRPPNMDSKGGCYAHFTADWCSPTGRMAYPYWISLGPPIDGDIVVPQSFSLPGNVIASGPGSAFTAIYNQPILSQIPEWTDAQKQNPLFAQMYKDVKPYIGKHTYSFVAQNWGPPVDYTVTYAVVHRVPSATLTSATPVGFADGTMFTVFVPDNVQAAIRVALGGSTISVTPGSSSADGSVKFVSQTAVTGGNLATYRHIKK